jgi:peptidyl-tRNA hydrolase
MYRKAIDKQPYAAKRWEKNGQPKICLKVPDETREPL